MGQAYALAFAERGALVVGELVYFSFQLEAEKLKYSLHKLPLFFSQIITQDLISSLIFTLTEFFYPFKAGTYIYIYFASTGD